MLRFFYLFLFLLLSISATAQLDDIPYNLNTAYLKGQKNVKTIKVTTTENHSDYISESYHLYNNLNQNYTTIGKFNDTISDKYIFSFDKEGRVVKEEAFQKPWQEHGDSMTLSWTIEYAYYADGLIKKVDLTHYGLMGLDSKTLILYKYDESGKLTEELRQHYNLSRMPSVYFEPNSTRFSEDQNPASETTHTQKYAYIGNNTTIKNYLNGDLKSTVYKNKTDNVITEYLVGVEGDTLRTIQTTLNKAGQKLKMQVSGDIDVSDFGEYGDGGGFELMEQKYNASGLLELITITSSRERDEKMFLKFEYFKR